MANQTVSVNRNLDDSAISGLLNGDSITINTNATLTCDSDNRWSQQAAVVGSVTIDSTSGGKMVVDGRNVWQVPFSSSTGNVPSLGTAGTYDATGGTSGCQGEFLGVWATGEMEPRASGAMPASGYVKFRRKSTNFTSGETITLAGGATIVASSVGKRSWIHFVGAYQATVTVPRLGSFEAYCDWFDLGTTSGATDQEFDFPFLDVCDGIQIETSAGSGAYEWYANAGTRSVSGTATIGGTTDPRAKYFCQRAAAITATTVNGSAVIATTQTSELVVGMPISASGSFPNSALYIAAINPGVSFTVSSNANAAASTTFYPWRNKLKLAQSTGTVVGFLPATGCKVRCPNVKLSTSLTPFAGQLLPTAIGDRYEFVTTSAGVVKMDTVDCGWYSNFSGAYSLDFRRVAQALGFAITNTATSNYIDNCVTSFESASGQVGLSISNCYGTTQVLNSWISRYDAASSLNAAASLLDSANITISGCKFSLGGANSTDNKRGNSNINSLSLTRCFDVSVASTLIMTGAFTLSGSLRVTITNLVSCDLEYGSTGSANSLTGAINVTAGSANVLIDGYSLLAGVTNIHPYLAVLNIGSNSADVEFRNAGTATAPINAGSAAAIGNIVTAASCLRTRFERLYFDNIRSAPLYIANTCQGVIVDNVWGDGADTQAIAGVNLTARGGRWSSLTTGQSSDYGRHWEDAFTSTTAGRLCLLMNEQTTETAAQVSIVAGTPKFTSTGNLEAPAVNDEVIFTMPYFAIGHTSLANTAPTITGTNPANFTLTYQIDLGSGWNGTWLALTGANLSSHTIPAYSSVFAMGGFRLKIRAVVNTANITNALTHVRIDTVTTTTEQQRQYALRNPDVGYTSVLAGSTLALYDNVSSERAGVAAVSSGSAIATPPWNANYTVVSRLRKPGYAPIEAATVVDVDGQTSVAAQEDWPTVPDTDPGALDITVTNHGASPVTWNGKQYSITITTTNDALTAAQVAQYISWNVSQDATFNGFNGLAWPYMVEPDGISFKTTRGRLVGSAGATLKGIRVVRSDGTTLVPGFSSLMADDGTTYVSPVLATASIGGLLAGSKVRIYNVTTATETYIGTPGTSYTQYYTDGTTYTAGDTINVRAHKRGRLTYETTVIATASGWTVSVNQLEDEVYTALGIDGSLVTGFAADYVYDEVNVTVAANFNIADMYAWWSYNLESDDGIRDFVGGMTGLDIGNFRINNATVDIYIDNTTATNLRQLDNRRIFRADEAYPVKSSGGGGIDVVWRNTILIAETGTSGLTPTESAQLAVIDDVLNLVAADEIHSASTIEKRLSGTAIVLLTKNHSGTPLSTFQAVDP